MWTPLALDTSAASPLVPWTPAVTFDTPGTSNLTQAGTGYYFQVGKLVIATFAAYVTGTKGTASGNLRIGGLQVLTVSAPPLTVPLGVADGFVSNVQGITWPSGASQFCCVSSGVGSSSYFNIGYLASAGNGLVAASNFPSSISSRFSGVFFYTTD